MGKRSVRGGRQKIRNVLYMATVSATQHNPAINTFFNQLKSRGKQPKVALTACMRKLIITLNAIIRDDVPWESARFRAPAQL